LPLNYKPGKICKHMATTESKIKKPLTTETKPATNELQKVAVNTQFTGDVYSRMVKAKKAKGFLNEQELIRVAVSYYLERISF